MLLQRGQVIAGTDAIQLRGLLRQLTNTDFTLSGMAGLADFDTHGWVIGLLARSLTSAGLIERTIDPMNSFRLIAADEQNATAEFWRLTVAGRALAKAHIGKPITRVRAHELLRGVIERAQILNEDRDGLLLSTRRTGDEHVEEILRRFPGGLM